MTSPLLLATDTGDIFVRTGTNTYSQTRNVTSPPPGLDSADTTFMTTQPGSAAKAFCQDYNTGHIVSTTDGGNTWITGGPFLGSLGYAGQRTVMDSSGNVYWAGLLDGTWGIWKAVNATATPTAICTFASPAQAAGLCLGKSYLWIGYYDGTTWMLAQSNLDGSGFTTFSRVTFPSATNVDTIMGGDPTNRIYVSQQGNWWLTSIDITDPSSPRVSSTASPASSGQNLISGATPATNLVAVSLVWDYSTEYGTLYRTNDGGVSWTTVVSSTAQLGTGPDGSGAGESDVLLVLDPANSTNYLVASCLPYVYLSTDQGVTWTVETVTVGSIGVCHQWNTVGILGSSSTSVPLLGTDNGYIVRQDPVAGWQIVFDDGGSHDPFTDVLYSLLTNPSATQSLWCYHTTFDGTYPALSSPNGGQTWNGGSNQPNPNEFLGIDAAGNLYSTVLYGGLQKSTDNGASWFTIYTPPGADQLAFQNVLVANGSVWFINLVGNTLMRCNLDGSGPTAYPAASLADGQYTIMGGGSSNRLLIYAASLSSDLLTVDITNPDSPTFTSVPNPFGATQVPVSVVPITNAVVLALTYDTDPDVQEGQLWRSADGGVSWTSVVDPTKQLQLDGQTGPVLIAADPANSNTVWAAVTIPYVYTSTDQGQTWSVQTVELDLGGGFGWTTLTLAGAGPVFGPILADTVQNLINRINADRAVRGLPAFPWTDPTITPGVTIKAVQFIEMSEAIQDLWTSKALGTLPDWTDGAPGGPSVGTAPTPMQTTHFTDLLDWLGTYEAAVPPLPSTGLGVTSKSFDPNAMSGDQPARPAITQSWAQNVLDTCSDFRQQVVRCEVYPTSGSGANFPLDDLGAYELALAIYTGLGIRVFVLFTLSLCNTSAQNPPMADLDPDTHTNAFITQWSEQAGLIAAAINRNNSEIVDFVLWNEPNNVNAIDPNTVLDAQHFAALLYQGWQNKLSGLNFYWGGIYTNPAGPFPDTGALDYIQAVYQQLVDWGIADIGGPWPWDGVNMHFDRDREDTNVDGFFSNLSGKRAGFGDNSPIIVGEWGVTSEDVSGPDGPALYSSKLGHLYSLLAPQADFLIYFSHHWVGEPPGQNDWGLYDYTWEPPVPPSTTGVFMLGAPRVLLAPFQAAPVPPTGSTVG